MRSTGETILHTVIREAGLVAGRLIPGAAILYLSVTLSSCHPHPRFTHEPPPPETRAEKPRSEESTEQEDRQTQSAVPAPQYGNRQNSAIDPVIFGRIIDDYLGVRYRLGGLSKSGIDCSGLAIMVYKEYSGKILPADVRAMHRLSNRVSYDELAYGDLVFFALSSNQPDHVGIYIGDGRFAHASESRGVVIDNLSDSTYNDSYRGARRVQ